MRRHLHGNSLVELSSAIIQEMQAPVGTVSSGLLRVMARHGGGHLHASGGEGARGAGGHAERRDRAAAGRAERGGERRRRRRPSCGRQRCIEHGLLLLSCGYREQVLRLIPALNVSDAEADEGLTIIEEAVRQEAR